MNTKTLFQSIQNGVYIYPLLRNDLELLRTEAITRGFRFYALNALFILNRTDLLHAFYEVGELPDYFGFNWDALEECLLDLSFAPANGYVFAIVHTSYLKDILGTDYDVLTDIFSNAGESWQKDGVIFKLLVDQ